jgi:hypothetical protein
MIVLEREQEFRGWLERNLQLGDRARGDIVSRAKRAAGLVNLTTAKSDSELAYRLSEAREFKKLTMTVRSQVKRAATLYRQFLDSGSSKSKGTSRSGPKR